MSYFWWDPLDYQVGAEPTPSPTFCSALWLLWSYQKKKKKGDFLPFFFLIFLLNEKIISFRNHIWEHYKKRTLNYTLSLVHNPHKQLKMKIYFMRFFFYCFHTIYFGYNSPSPSSSKFLPTSSPIWIYSLLKIVFHYSLVAGSFSSERQRGNFQSLKDAPAGCLALGQHCSTLFQFFLTKHSCEWNGERDS